MIKGKRSAPVFYCTAHSESQKCIDLWVSDMSRPFLCRLQHDEQNYGIEELPADADALQVNNLNQGGQSFRQLLSVKWCKHFFYVDFHRRQYLRFRSIMACSSGWGGIRICNRKMLQHLCWYFLSIESRFVKKWRLASSTKLCDHRGEAVGTPIKETQTRHSSRPSLGRTCYCVTGTMVTKSVLSMGKRGTIIFWSTVAEDCSIAGDSSSSSFNRDVLCVHRLLLWDQ